MRKVMHNKRYILGAVGAFLLSLFAVLLLPGTATAAKNVENVYAVVVTTGNLSGEGVSYFGLEYVDAEGVTHTEYLFPHKGGLQDSVRFASDGAYNTSEKALDRGKTNTFLFRPAYEVAEIVGLDIYCQGDQGSLYAWEVGGLRLYRVDQIVDVVSDARNHTIRFNGSQIAYLQERSGNGGVTFSWTGDTLFRLRGEETSYPLVFETRPYSMDGNSDYLVRLDLADVNGAGLEHMNQDYNEKNSLQDADFGEYMAIQIEYMDTFGDLRTVTQAVMTSSIDWLMKNGVSPETEIAALAQQGESLVFDCYLQDMLTVKAVTLHTGAEASSLLNRWIASAESASLTGLSIYAADTVSVDLPDEGNVASAPQYFFSGEPLYYYTANSPEGETVPANGSHYLSMRPYEKGVNLVPVSATEKYLIKLIADPSQILRAPDDVMVELRYVDMTGAERTGEIYSVRNGAKEFYGYWPASVDDFAYKGQINSEQGICFVMELPQVEHFTGLTISVPDGSSDWQMKGFSVMRLDSLSKRIALWEDVVAQEGSSNRRYYRDAEGYTVFTMEEKALIQPGNSSSIDFISQSVQEVEDFDWSQYRYAMTYDQCSSNLGLAKIRRNYTVQVQVQSGATSLLDGYGDNGSKNRFYFLLEFENGVSGYVLANQQLSADGFRSGMTESFVISTNYDYGELLAVHIIPDDISEDSDPYDKLNIAQIRVRRNDEGSISKEWIVQNVGWVGIDYRDEGANSSITGQQGRTETDIARIYPISYSSYALNLEFRIGTGTYAPDSGPFYGTMEGTLEYYNQEGRRNQLTFDVIRAMYDYANKSPMYMDNGMVGSSGSPLAVTDNSFMFRENHTDRFVISVSDVARLGKLSLNMKSFNGGTLQITNVSAAMVMENGLLQINEQDEYARTGASEYLCEDSVEKVPAFDLYLPSDRNIYQEIYFSEHEPIKLDAVNNTWVGTVSRVPNSQNDLINLFVYPADDASGRFDIAVRVQYTNNNGVILETGATKLNKMTDADGKTVYAINGLKATGLSTLNRIFVKTNSADTVDAYIDHIVVQQVRTGVVINAFYADGEHRNANWEFYVVPYSLQDSEIHEQKVYLSLGEQTESANLVSENRDIAVALQYTTANGGDQILTSPYIFLTDQQYRSIKAGDLIELTFRESYVQEVKGILVTTSGNVKAHIAMACVDTFVTEGGTKEHGKHFAIPTGAVGKNQTFTMAVDSKVPVEMLEMEFVTALSDAYLESGTNDPIAMVIGYSNRDGALREVVLPNIRNYVVSEGNAFATGSTTRIRILLRDAASVQFIRLMPYNSDPQITAIWKPSQITLSLGVGGSVQRSTRAIEEYIQEDREIPTNLPMIPEMVGGMRISLANIILAADVACTNEAGYFGTSYRVTSASNKTLSLTASSGATVKARVILTNSTLGYGVTAVQKDGMQDLGSLIARTEEGFILTMPENTSGQDQTYEITVSSRENENLSVVITVTVKSEAVDEPTEPTEPPQPTEPSVPTEATEPTEPSV